MIETINRIAQNWFDWQIAMLWQVAVVIVIVAAVDFLIKKWVWPQVRYALWLLVLVKLVMPPTLTSSTSLTAMIPSYAEKTVKVQISQPEEISQALVPHEAIEPINPVAAAVLPPEELPPITKSLPEAISAEHVPSDAIVQPSIAVTIPETPSVSWKSYAFFGWLAGVVLLSAWLILRLRSLRREHFKELPQANLPDGFDDLLVASANRLKLRRLPEVILTDKVSCPAVFGVFKPVLLMPADKIKNLTKEDTEHILLHELAHIKRGDLLVHAVYMILQIAYWFNPLLWLIRKQVQNLRELCCDATVARHLKEKTCRYRETLLETARQLLAEPVDPGLGLMGLFEDSNWLVDRLKWLEKRTWRNRPLRIAITFVLVVVMAGCVLPMAKAAKFKVPEEFVGHWKGKSNIVVNWTKQRQLAIDIEVMADGKVEGIIGDSILKDATFQRKNKFITDLFQHSTVYMIRGELEGAIIKAEDVNRKSIGLLLTDVIDGKIEGGFHTSGRHFGNKKTMVLSAADMELRKAGSFEEPKMNYIAALPNGETVEIVGVCEHPSADKEWWGIDGKVLPEAPYHTTGSECTSHRDGYKFYEFALKLSGPDTMSYYCLIPGSVQGSNTGSPYDKNGKSIYNLKAFTANPPEELESVNVRIGVAASEWKTVAAIKPGDHEETFDVDEFAIAFGKPYDKDGRTWVPVVHNFNHAKRIYAKRLVAITKSGKIRKSGSSGSGGNKLNSLTYSFRGLSLDQIKEFQFQTRPYIWADFKNVSLRPNKKTDVETVVSWQKKLPQKNHEPGNDPISFLSKGATVELVGVCEHPSVGEQWWGIDGAALSEAPYYTTGNECTSHKEGFKYYEFALKLNHPDTSYYWMIPGSGHGSDTGSPSDKNGRQIPYIKAYATNLPKQQATANVRIGAAASQWKPVAAIKPTDREKTINAGEYSIAFGAVYLEGGRTLLPVIHNYNHTEQRYATRVIAVTKSDQIIRSGCSGSFGSKLNNLTYIFNKLPLDNVKRFEFQIRPYIWTTFNNVSLKPNLKTDVHVGSVSVSKSPQKNQKVDFDGYFPDSASGAQALEKLWNDPGKDLKDAGEILETVRKGLRRYNGRGNILRWIGNLFIWGKSPQNEKAIELMYHASGSPDRGLYGDAIYFGLSVTKDKTPEILQAMAAVAMKTDDYYNVTGRILWGCKQHRAELIACLDPYFESEDEEVRNKVHDVRDYFTDSKAFMAKRAEDHVESIRSQYGDKLNRFKEQLLNGNSQTRLDTLNEINSKSIMSIVDDSFLDAFAACTKDSNANVRTKAARMFGGKFVWSGDPKVRAIEILTPLLNDPDREVRGAAVYYGLSTVRSPNKELVAKIMATILDDREVNYYGRVIWGLRRNKQGCIDTLKAWMDQGGQDKQMALKAYEIYEDVTGEKLPKEYAERFAGQKSDVHDGLVAMCFREKPISKDELKMQIFELLADGNLRSKVMDFYIFENRGSSTALFTSANLADRNAVRDVLTKDNAFQVTGYAYGYIGPTGSGWLDSLEDFRKANETNRVSLPEISSSISVTGIVVDTKGRPCGNVYIAPSEVGFRNAVRSDLMGNFILKDVKPEHKNWVAHSAARNAMGLFTISRADQNKPLRIVLRYNEAKAETRVVDGHGKGLSNSDVNLVVGTPDGRTWIFKARKRDQPGLYSGQIPAGDDLTIYAKTLSDDGKDEYTTAVRKLSDNQILFELPYLMLAESKSQPDFDQNITNDRRVRIGGRIVDEQNKPILAALVTVYYNIEGYMSMWVKEIMTDKKGKWSICIPEKYSNLTMRLSHPDFIGHHFERYTAPDNGELLKATSTLIMKRGVRVKGVVTDENGKVVENALISAGRSYRITPYGEIREDSTTARTDSDGSFSIGGIPVGEREITVSGQGYAPTITMVEVANQMDPIAVTVAKGVTYKGRLTDVDGNGVEGAKIDVGGWKVDNDRKTLTRITQTDSQGNFSIENLPSEGVLRFDFGAKGYMGFAKEMPEDLSKPDQIVIYKKPAITGHVVDSLTGEPVQKFRVISGCLWSASGKDISWSRYYKHDVDDEQGRFSRDNHGFFLTYPFDGAFYVKIVAEGYLPEITPAVKLGQESESFVIKLTKADPVTGIICDKNGTPVANAEVAWVDPGKKAYVSNGQIDHSGFTNQAETIIRSGENGTFKLPPSRNEGLIVAVHEKGYAEIESGSFTNGSKIQLTPWAKIEGIIDTGSAAAKKIEVTIYSDSSQNNEGKPEIRWLFNRFSITGQSFEKDKIPAIPLSVIKSIDGNKSGPLNIVPISGERLTFEL